MEEASSKEETFSEVIDRCFTMPARCPLSEVIARCARTLGRCARTLPFTMPARCARTIHRFTMRRGSGGELAEC